MAVYRQIQVSFWQDPFVISLTPEEKYFYVYLMSNSKTTQCGIYELPKRVIEFETGYNRETVDKLLNRFIDYGKIMYHDPTQEVMLLNWLKHNSIKSPKVVMCVKKEIASVKNYDYKYRFAKLCKDLGYPIDSLSIDLGEEKEEEKEKEETKEEEKEREEDASLPVSDNSDIKSDLLKLMNECQVEKIDFYSIDQINSFIGVVETGVIQIAIKKASKKHINYAINTLTNWVKEGKTTLKQLMPSHRTAARKPEIEVASATPEVAATISDEEYEEMIRFAEEMKLNKKGA